jgi:rhodanese-related sulfurtransferase
MDMTSGYLANGQQIANDNSRRDREIGSEHSLLDGVVVEGKPYPWPADGWPPDDDCMLIRSAITIPPRSLQRYLIKRLGDHHTWDDILQRLRFFSHETRFPGIEELDMGDCLVAIHEFLDPYDSNTLPPDPTYEEPWTEAEMAALRACASWQDAKNLFPDRKFAAVKRHAAREGIRLLKKKAPAPEPEPESEPEPEPPRMMIGGKFVWTEDETAVIDARILAGGTRGPTAEVFERLRPRSEDAVRLKWTSRRRELMKEHPEVVVAADRWTAREDEIVREAIADGIGAAEIYEALPGRTPRAVRNRYRELANEDQEPAGEKPGDAPLLKALARGESSRDVARKLAKAGRDPAAIERRMEHLRLREASTPPGTDAWTRNEDKQIRRWLETGQRVGKLPGRTAKLTQARSKFVKFGLKTLSAWTDEEEELLMSGKPTRELMAELPGRTRAAITQRRRELLLGRSQTKEWAPEEDAALREAVANAGTWNDAFEVFSTKFPKKGPSELARRRWEIINEESDFESESSDFESAPESSDDELF